MHPALSIILFTTASGAGYGLLAWLGLGSLAGILAPGRGLGLAGFGLALALVTFGLLSSTFHLGHPERAWRAVTQWRSSWLSREGVLALLTYPVAGLMALGWIVFGRTWNLAALATVLLALSTIVATAMIYRSLKTIQRWSNGWVVPVYLALGLMTGALLANTMAGLFGQGAPALGWIAAAAILVAWMLKSRYWRFIDETSSVSDSGSATGLGALGPVRMLASPNSQENYLLKEMGFQIARKHAAKLRRIATIAGFLLPLALTLAAFAGPPLLATIEAVLAALSALAGVAVERWLFFAEARHTVTLYYGAERA
jgi:DMSO reductase anchor subunit